MARSFSRRSRRAIPWRALLVALTILSLTLSLLPVTARVALAADFAVTVTETADTNNACATSGTGTCSLRDAIRFANSKTASDTTTITLPAGTYTLSQAGDDNTAAAGDLDITQKVVILGAGASTTTIDGAGIDRIFDLRSGGGLVIGASITPGQGVTLTGGQPTATLSGGYTGGAIRTNSGAGAVELNDTHLQANRATTAVLGLGGAIFHDGGGALTLRRSTVSSNTAANNGGGLYASNSAGTVTVTETLFQGNSAAGAGGGIFFNSNSAGTISASAIIGNSASGFGGGGLWSEGTSLTIANSTVSGNTALAGAGGGGIHFQDSGNTLNLNNSTVAFNSTGIRRNSGTFNAHNTIIANSTGGANCAGTITNVGNNIDDGTSCGFTTANNSLSGTDPQLQPLALNAPGLTETHALAQTSPAVNHVPSADANCTGTDQRGVPRPQATNCDSGAYELLAQPTIVGVVADAGPTIGTSSGSTSGGITITITGTGFQPGVTVSICSAAIVSNGTAVNGSQIDATTITCTLNPGATGLTDVTVTNTDGGTATATGAFTYVAPTVASIAPTAGPTVGGTPVTITGTLFDANATVTIGGAPCLSVVVVDATTITCTTPAGTGTVDVVVTNPAAPSPSGTATLAAAFEYLTTQGAQPSPASLTFGPQQVNTTSATQPVTLTNTGTTPLEITDVAITGANPSDFAQTNDCPVAPMTLAANASCTVQVSFTPTGTGERGAALTFTNNSGGVAGSQQNVALSGTGTAPTVAFSPTSLAFGNQQVGTTSATKDVTLTNNGTAPLEIGSVALAGADAGDFVLTNVDCTGTIAVEASCTLRVAFRPTASDLRVASIEITDNAGGTPGSVQRVPLSGGALPAYTVTASTNGSGTVSPAGTSNFTAGAEASYTASPNAGQVFVGWTLDGVYVGYASPLKFTVDGNRTLVAQFVPRPTFNDIPTTDADYQAIIFLTAFGVINPNGVNGTGNFEPDRPVVRAEMASFIARVFDWDTEFHLNSFPDQCDANGVNCVDAELWNNVAALQDYGVVGGYTDSATCAAAGTTAPCYLPRDPVKRVQVISIIARAFIQDPTLRPDAFWDRLAANPAQYTNVPDSGTQRSDLTTYTANAGQVPGAASDTTFPDPEGNGSRRFVIRALFQAFNAWYGVDRVP